MIKFRVWSIKERKFVQDEMFLFINEDGDLFERSDIDWQGFSIDRLKADDFIIEQGFEIDGKTAFIGDKVSFEHGYGKSREVIRGVVCMKNNIPSVETMAITWLLTVLRDSNFKIISNIHEEIKQ